MPKPEDQQQLVARDVLQAVQSLFEVTCADVQSISVLRSIAKSNSPGLVASLSMWAAYTYGTAAASAKLAPFSISAPKLRCYAEFKAVFFRAYALTFQGLTPCPADMPILPQAMAFRSAASGACLLPSQIAWSTQGASVQVYLG